MDIRRFFSNAWSDTQLSRFLATLWPSMQNLQLGVPRLLQATLRHDDSWKVPIDVCETIIDFAALPDESSRIHPYIVLRACCLVCKAWLPRSQFNLYRWFHITNAGYPERNDLLGLVQKISAMPQLALLIEELYVHPPWEGIVGGSSEPRRRSQLDANTQTTGQRNKMPFAVAIGPPGLSEKLTSLHTAILDYVDWSHPRLYTLAMSRYPALTCLHLCHMTFASGSLIPQLTWGLPQLTTVVLLEVNVIRDITDSELNQIAVSTRKLRNQRTTETRLKEVYLYGDLESKRLFPPVHAGGLEPSLRKISIISSLKHWKYIGLLPLLSRITEVTEVRVGIRIDCTERFPGFLPTLLSTMARSHFTKIEVDLSPSILPLGGYGISRQQMHAHLKDPKLWRAIAQFPFLTSLRFAIVDSNSDMYARDWEIERMLRPLCPQNVRLQVHVERYVKKDPQAHENWHDPSVRQHLETCGDPFIRHIRLQSYRAASHLPRARYYSEWIDVTERT